MTVYYTGKCVTCGTLLSDITGMFYVEVVDGKVTGKAYCKNSEECRAYTAAQSRRATKTQRARERENALVPV